MPIVSIVIISARHREAKTKAMWDLISVNCYHNKKVAIFERQNTFFCDFVVWFQVNTFQNYGVNCD